MYCHGIEGQATDEAFKALHYRSWLLAIYLSRPFTNTLKEKNEIKKKHNKPFLRSQFGCTLQLKHVFSPLKIQDSPLFSSENKVPSVREHTPAALTSLRSNATSSKNSHRCFRLGLAGVFSQTQDPNIFCQYLHLLWCLLLISPPLPYAPRRYMRWSTNCCEACCRTWFFILSPRMTVNNTISDQVILGCWQGCKLVRASRIFTP